MGYLDNTGLAYFWGKIKDGLMSSAEKTKLSGIATDATKNYVRSATLVLFSTNWSNKSQTRTATGVTTNNTVFVYVRDGASGIMCTTQGTNTLTFTCEELPVNDVYVDITIIS